MQAGWEGEISRPSFAQVILQAILEGTSNEVDSDQLNLLVELLSI